MSESVVVEAERYCKGCLALGTACGDCPRCRLERDALLRKHFPGLFYFGSMCAAVPLPVLVQAATALERAAIT